MKEADVGAVMAAASPASTRESRRVATATPKDAALAGRRGGGRRRLHGRRRG